MGSAVAEIGLDLNLCSMKTVGSFLKDAAGDGRAAKLEESVRTLEEERRKIEAFKRELPLCMLLLCDVIEVLKKELEQCRGTRLGHAFEEFLPPRSKFQEEGGVKWEADSKEKMNWMSSAQLWSDNSSTGNNDDGDENDKKVLQEKNGRPDRRPEENLLFLQSKSRSEVGNGGAFLPFKELPAPTVVPRSKVEEEKPVMAVTLPDLSLLAPAAPIKCAPCPVSAIIEDHRVGGAGSKGVVRAQSSTPTPGAHLSLQAQQQPPRKARRCWSPELHRRFVVALQQLGGAQVATPKQIRDLMKVDGLTNDEVKSHLQKYRLHTRRMPNAATAANRPVVVVGGLWVSPENYSSSSQQSASHSGSPQSPLHLGGSNRSPSGIAGDSCEEEDGKSESYSWK